MIDLGNRLGVVGITGGSDPAVLEQLWQHRRPLFEHLGHSAERCWLAEQDGQLIGYARSIRRDGVQQLTEFFVRPGQQSGGVGRELLARAFPADGATHRVIIATLDTRALARYLKLGVTPRFAGTYFEGKAQAIEIATDLSIKLLKPSDDSLNTLGTIDRVVLGYRRDADHRWLMDVRHGFLYERDGQAVGYGYMGQSNGPFALLDAGDYPAVLAHAEREAAAGGYTFGIEVPLINRAAVDHLLARGCHMDGFYEFFMSDAPLGHYENYIFSSPPLFS